MRRRFFLHSRPGPFFLAAWLAVNLVATQLFAGDWPQIHGPARNAIAAADEKLLDAWPVAGPTVAWRADVGAGYAGPAVAAGKVVVFHRLGDIERIEAFDLKTGGSLWKADFAASYSGGIDADKGPRCVPVIHGGNVYVFGAAGDLHSVELASGKKRWSRDLATDYTLPDSYFGAGSTPIVAGNRLWVNLGGRNAGLVALALDSGKTLSAQTSELASYSSPTLGKLDGQDQVVFVTRYNCMGIEPTTGKQLFKFPFGMRGPTVNAATPLVVNGQVFVTASYGVGAKAVGVSAGKPTIQWENDTSLSSQYTTPVSVGEHYFGIDGREDIGVASLRCLDGKTGKVLWSEDEFGMAHLIAAGDKILVTRNDGGVWLLKADPQKCMPLAKAKIAPGTVRALPALSNGRLLIRTVAEGEKGALVCAIVGQ